MQSTEQSAEWCHIPQTIGSYVSREYYLNLVNGFDQQYPTEQKSVFIPKEFILETLNKFPVVTGLRFMYGLKEGADPSSRTIVLMACDNTSSDRHIPNLIPAPDGYLADTGEQLTLDECWDLFNRYVDRMQSLMPGETRRRIPRACFFGINIMRSLLDTPGCVGIRYHFGYNPTTKIVPDRYETVMEAVDADRQSLNMFVDIGQRCPADCDNNCTAPIVPIPVGWPFSSSYEGPEQISEGTLYEMFHYVTPPLFEAVHDAQRYKEHFSECLALVETGNLPEAKQVLRKELESMMKKYIFDER